MIYAQQIEKEKLKEKSREAKRVRIGDGDFSHSRSDGYGCSRFRQGFFGQGFSRAPTLKFKKDTVSNPTPKEGNGDGNGSLAPTCEKCGKSYLGIFLMGTDNCFMGEIFK
ncbi:hypothetical protein MTR67_026089 [Solanum verrucosum]|uniref:Uncharacterized protein n=1 Tax=Solanum verrucosum TaxID=315347 RepID=A0AAF0R720_SOLVR|nr:hypothetical protein MTR67_026089 [Solanum verrucosum]